MTLVEKLAKTFVKAAHEKRAAEEVVRPRVISPEDIPGAFRTGNKGLRSEFEDSLRHEEILRDKAMEYSRLARQRAQDQQGAGLEFLKRLGPLPYSGGEAAWRLPLEAAGGVGGYMAGSHYGLRADPREIAKTLRATTGKSTGKISIPLLAELNVVQGSRGGKKLTSTESKALAKMLHGAPSETLAAASGRTPLFFGEAKKLVQGLEAKGISRSTLREAFRRVASESKDGPFLPRGVARWGGAGAGFLAAGALTGLPMAIRAGALRRSGGEMAQSARKRMLEAITRAEREQFKRDNLLRTLNGEPPIPLTEWKQQRKQIKRDWRESTRDYRDVAKARRKGMRRYGTSVPPLPPTEEEA
jgi:hypothetical protein